MKTYNLVAKTNGYIASRDAHFNGKTVVTLAENLSYDDAKAKLIELFSIKYDFAYEINSEEEYVKVFKGGLIEEAAINAKLDVDVYFEQTKRRWMLYSKLTADRFHNYEGEGYYEEGILKMSKNDESFEYDSRYYSIEENID